jgi:beta-xylosidase
MRNILLDDEGRLWLVDWGWSGFFPTGFEYLAMRFAAQKDRELKGWQTSIKFMAEPSFEMERWLVGVGYDYADL